MMTPETKVRVRLPVVKQVEKPYENDGDSYFEHKISSWNDLSRLNAYLDLMQNAKVSLGLSHWSYRQNKRRMRCLLNQSGYLSA